MNREVERRTLLAWAAKSGFAAVLGLTGVALKGTSAMAYCQYSCTNYQTLRDAYCCVLGFYNNCSDLSCFHDCEHNDWWVWTCCWNRSLVYCYECCTGWCSKAVYYPGVPCVSATKMPAQSWHYLTDGKVA
ncbi:MAG: hypothetical protein ACYDAL_02685 [Candidatus Dormibacteraceae bacterium]